MSPASEPPYPPGRQGSPTALPARQARALPAGSSSAGNGGDEPDDTTIPRSSLQRQAQAGPGEPGGYPGAPGGRDAARKLPGPGKRRRRPQDPDGWFGRDR